VMEVDRAERVHSARSYAEVQAAAGRARRRMRSASWSAPLDDLSAPLHRAAAQSSARPNCPLRRVQRPGPRTWPARPRLGSLSRMVATKATRGRQRKFRGAGRSEPRLGARPQDRGPPDTSSVPPAAAARGRAASRPPGRRRSSPRPVRWPRARGPGRGRTVSGALERPGIRCE
jgi:hypothetical protein